MGQFPPTRLQQCSTGRGLRRQFLWSIQVLVEPVRYCSGGEGGCETPVTSPQVPCSVVVTGPPTRDETGFGARVSATSWQHDWRRLLNVPSP